MKNYMFANWSIEMTNGHCSLDAIHASLGEKLSPIFLDWYDPKESTKNICADIATILMDETFSNSYLKYTN